MRARNAKGWGDWSRAVQCIAADVPGPVTVELAGVGPTSINLLRQSSYLQVLLPGQDSGDDHILEDARAFDFFGSHSTRHLAGPHECCDRIVHRLQFAR